MATSETGYRPDPKCSRCDSPAWRVCLATADTPHLTGIHCPSCGNLMRTADGASSEDPVVRSAASVAPEIDTVAFEEFAADVVADALRADAPKPDPRDAIRDMIGKLKCDLRWGGLNGQFPTMQEAAERLDAIEIAVYALG